MRSGMNTIMRLAAAGSLVGACSMDRQLDGARPLVVFSEYAPDWTAFPELNLRKMAELTEGLSESAIYAVWTAARAHCNEEFGTIGEGGVVIMPGEYSTLIEENYSQNPEDFIFGLGIGRVAVALDPSLCIDEWTV